VPRLLVRTTRSQPPIVAVTINGKPWHLVASLAEASPRDRVFTATTTPDGKTTVQFGDGAHGAQPPAGGKLTVAYRAGGGAGGNVALTVARTKSNPTLDQVLWVAIRNRTRALSFDFYGGRERRPR